MVLIWFAGTSAFACNYVDPQVSAGGFKRWCDCIGGDYSERPYRCETSGGGTSGYSSSANPYQGFFDAAFGAIGAGMAKNMECLLGLGCGDPKAAAIEQERLRRLAEEEKARKKIRRDRIKRERQMDRVDFESKKEDMLGMMKDTLADPMEPKGLEPLPELEVRDGTLGAKTLHPRKLSESPGEVSKERAYAAKLHCASYLMRKSRQAAAGGRFYDSTYLSTDAADLLSNKRESARVECPKVPEITNAAPIQDKEGLARAEKLKKHTVVMSRLYSRASQQVADYQVVASAVAKSKKGKKEAQKRVKQAEIKVKELETKEDAPEQPGSVPKTKTDKKSSLEAARALLRKAKGILKQSEKDLADSLQEQKDMDKRIRETRDLVVGADKDPKQMDSLYKKFTAQSKGDK
ncbi:hypothetical protein ACFL6Y_08825 [Elusimicrobiota bacterium]